MNFLQLLPTLLLVSLALVMFGLGLSLSVADFQRLLKYPKAVAVALVLLVVLLPAACYALIVVLGLPPVFAVGLMLLAASPGGVSANLFSHLFGGNVGGVLTWLNGERAPATLAWSRAAPQSAVRQAPTYTSYDTLATGKRDSWVLLLADTQDFSKAKTRNWVVDVWGAATAASNAEAVLLAGTYNATNLQNAIGGTSRTTGTVTALDLTYTGAAAMGDAEWLVSPANCQ